MGLAALPWYVAHRSVKEGSVTPVMSQWTLPSQAIHAVFPSPRLVPTKVTGLIAWLRGHFDGEWWSR
jgi:DNA-binding transcriptional LysR family regulator